MDVLIYLMLITTCCFSGVNDGILYSKKGADAFKWNEHIVLVINRAIPFVFLLTGFYCIKNLGDALFWAMIYISMFSFFHNGCYFVTRRKIDVQYYRFDYDKSKTSTSVIELSFIQRLLLFVFSIILLLIKMYLWQ